MLNGNRVSNDTTKFVFVFSGEGKLAAMTSVDVESHISLLKTLSYGL